MAIAPTIIGPEVFRIKQGDNSPPLYHTCRDDNSQRVVNLAGAVSCTFTLRKQRPLSAIAVTSAAVLLTPEIGEVRFDWTSLLTAIAGDFYGEFAVTWPDGRVRTFPTNGYILIEIEASLS